ncbi:hypothetical protein CWE15_01910 [Aliidiomarina taiwanensis]|uniref:GPP34 family phosphoprotein n=1 Tax=Aliidiomarina taiwanensis TaxID=946228 RepID=A0A432X981_9GAMM|nr:GPP34 family phosphoprotein [Aliidiomarina taiwanensis]RUO43962.1 hypothetical protein CWE15_01910 [Aliidiomarina taiwanensis]
MPEDLTLYQAIMLLSLCEEKGTMNGMYVEYATAGALAAELLLLGRIQVQEDNKNRVAVVTESSTGDALLDEALALIAKSKRPKKLKDWIFKLGGIKDLKHKVANSLAESGIVSADKEKILWLFERRVYPEINPIPEQQLRQAMRQLVLDENQEVDSRTAIVTALANSAKLLPQVFSKQELRQHKKRIQQLERGELVSQAAKETVQAIQAAIMITVMLPAITAATTSSTTSSSC